MPVEDAAQVRFPLVAVLWLFGYMSSMIVELYPLWLQCSIGHQVHAHHPKVQPTPNLTKCIGWYLIRNYTRRGSAATPVPQFGSAQAGSRKPSVDTSLTFIERECFYVLLFKCTPKRFEQKSLTGRVRGRVRLRGGRRNGDLGAFVGNDHRRFSAARDEQMRYLRG